MNNLAMILRHEFRGLFGSSHLKVMSGLCGGWVERMSVRAWEDATAAYVGWKVLFVRRDPRGHQ